MSDPRRRFDFDFDLRPFARVELIIRVSQSRPDGGTGMTIEQEDVSPAEPSSDPLWLSMSLVGHEHYPPHFEAHGGMVSRLAGATRLWSSPSWKLPGRLYHGRTSRGFTRDNGLRESLERLGHELMAQWWPADDFGLIMETDREERCQRISFDLLNLIDWPHPLGRAMNLRANGDHVLNAHLCFHELPPRRQPALSLPLRVAFRPHPLERYDDLPSLADEEDSEGAPLVQFLPSEDEARAHVLHVFMDARWPAPLVDADLMALRLSPDIRLLVIHQGRRMSPESRYTLAWHALEQGAGGVLFVPWPVSRGRRWLEEFYRQLPAQPSIHHLTARLAGYEGHGPGTLFTRPDGEFSLLLSRIRAEQQAALQSMAGVELEWSREITARPERIRDILVSRADHAFRALITEYERAIGSLIIMRHEDLTRIARGGRAKSQGANSDIQDAIWAQGLTREAARRQALLHTMASREPEEVARDAARAIEVWLEAGGVGLTPGAPLGQGEEADLVVQVQALDTSTVISQFLTEPRSMDALVSSETDRLDVVLFLDQALLAAGATNVAQITLPRLGASSRLSFPLRATEVGLVQGRIAIYHASRLLQSLVFTVEVTAAEQAAPPERAALVAQLDYAETADLMLLEEARPATLSLFTNEGPHGSHWVGLYSSERKISQLRDFSPSKLEIIAANLRERLQECQDSDAFAVDEQGEWQALTDQTTDKRASLLVRLAEAGADGYAAIFGNCEDLTHDSRRALVDALKGSGLLSIARCRPSEVNVPWAALYHLPLINEPGEEATYCDKARRGEISLSSPEACRDRADCPRRTDPKHTVCPFGFLGVSLEIEQPIGLTSADSGDDARAELIRQAAGRDLQSIARPEPLTLFAAYHHEFAPHVNWLSDRIIPRASVVHEMNVRAIREEIEAGKHSIQYFFWYAFTRHDERTNACPA